MKQVTALMINLYEIKKLKFDFMGYTFANQNTLSYHHLIIPARLNGPMTVENGAVLNRNTAHDYIHRIEHVDPEIFGLITSEMIDENIKGRLDIENLKKIRDLLLNFEKEHCSDTMSSGKPLIKEEYVKRRIPLNTKRR